jgi:hypothetical protein
LGFRSFFATSRSNSSSFQRYDIGKINPRFSFKPAEFMLRCFCNYDLCNREKNFFGYINALKDDSATRDVKTGAVTRR